MLSREEKKRYILSHKKDFQDQENNLAKEMYELLVKQDRISNNTLMSIYKLQKKRNPGKRIKKPVLFKTTKIKPLKINNKILRKYYMANNTNHKETVEGIDLQPYLKKIRNKRKEHELILLIRNHKVIKEYLFTSNNYTNVNVFKYEKHIKENAKKYKAKIYSVHNHPISVSAKPSISDIRSFSHRINKYKKEGITFIDAGVVTFDDYYSYKQALKETKKVMQTVKNDGIKNKIALDLIETTFICKNKGVLKIKKRHHPNYIINRAKREEVKKTSYKEYNKARALARNEINSIIKRYPKYDL